MVLISFVPAVVEFVKARQEIKAQKVKNEL
jgi:hypothetical protein